MTEGQTPAGWYDDGQGQLRWYDGAAWTEHVQPLPTPAAPPVPEQTVQQAPAAQAVPPAAQAQPVPQVAQTQPPVAAGAAAGAGAAIGAPGSHGEGDPWAEPTPFYRKSWFLILLGVVVLAIIGGIFALASGGDDEPTGSVPSATNGAISTPSSTASVAGGTSGVGADAATIAAKAGCAVSATIPATASTAPGAAPKSKVACTLNGATYTVVTWNSVADQAAEGSLAKAFTQPVEAGTKYYATGEGWTAFDTTYDQAAATAFATPAGGTVKGVVVVLASGAPTP